MVEPVTWYRLLLKKNFLYSNIHYNENYMIYNTSFGKVKIHLHRYMSNVLSRTINNRSNSKAVQGLKLHNTDFKDRH